METTAEACSSASPPELANHGQLRLGTSVSEPDQPLATLDDLDKSRMKDIKLWVKDWDSSARMKHIRQVPFSPVPEKDSTDFANALRQHVPRRPTVPRANEMAAYSAMLLAINPPIEAHPLNMALKKGKHVRLCLRGYHPFTIAMVSTHQQQRARHLLDGGSISTVPYTLDAVSAGEYDYYNSPMPISTLLPPVKQLQNAKTSRTEENLTFITEGALEALREHGQYRAHVLSQAAHVNDGLCLSTTLMADGRLSLFRFFNDLTRRIKSLRQMLTGLIQSESATNDMVLTLVRDSLVKDVDTFDRMQVLAEPALREGREGGACYHGDGTSCSSETPAEVYSRISKEAGTTFATLAMPEDNIYAG